MRYQAICACQHSGHRFRMGEFLPDGWEPNEYFKPVEEAARIIKEERIKTLGIRQKVSRGARKAAAIKVKEMKNTADLEETEAKLNFLTATGNDFDKFTRAQLAGQVLEQFDVGLNIDGRSKADLIKKGIEIAMEKKKDEN